MFLPLHDQNPLKIVPFQFVTVTIILINIAVFAWQAFLPLGDENSFVLGYGMVPAVLFDHSLLPPDIVRLPAEITLLTYMFLHTDVWHLLGNMLFLWVFADNIEDAMGHFRFALFYLLCGIAAGLCHGLFEADSIAPLIGASGAAAGVLGAYLLLHPKVKILVLLFGRLPLVLPAYLLIAGWVGLQLFALFYSDENISWWAHIGGFLVGAALLPLLRDKSIPLLDRGTPH
ncbi:MAG: rhomboid family intramembrane serine protease [Candidatus Competibacteraceae bacterium]|nr:rhomboid family intramembrane serine protease [Candidatus Competibacteraceae bacterium]MCB1815527.1 rhomboid family intramembrane serine protease [Candidatus Competibacteraceae bacterium]